MNYEMCVAKGFEGVSTGIRAVVMSGNKDDVPHTLSVTCPKTGDTFMFLLTIRGRKPICLRCHEVGHYRRDCFAPYCRFCQSYDHTSESCSSSKSYASAARGKGNEVAESADQIAEEEERQEMEGMATEPAIGPVCKHVLLIVLVVKNSEWYFVLKDQSSRGSVAWF